MLRKYICKPDPDCAKLYRYVWLKSQANHLGAFLSPKTFALATCTEHAATEYHRNKVKVDTMLPPSKSRDSVNLQIMTGERTIIISDLPRNWKSNNGALNDISSVTTSWGWNSIQQYTPENYDPKVDYLEQPCKAVASLIDSAGPEDDLHNAAIHVWVSIRISEPSTVWIPKP